MNQQQIYEADAIVSLKLNRTDYLRLLNKIVKDNDPALVLSLP